MELSEHSHWGWQVARHGVILFWNSSRTYYEVPDFSGSSCIIISRCIDINIFKGFRIIVQDSFFSIQLSYFSINVQLKIEFPLKYYLTSDYLLGVYLPQFPFVLFEICTIYFLQTPADRTKRCPASRCWWSGGRCCPGSRWTERAVSGQSRSSSPLHSPIWRPPESSQTLKRFTFTFTSISKSGPQYSIDPIRLFLLTTMPSPWTNIWCISSTGSGVMDWPRYKMLKNGALILI